MRGSCVQSHRVLTMEALRCSVQVQPLTNVPSMADDRAGEVLQQGCGISQLSGTETGRPASGPRTWSQAEGQWQHAAEESEPNSRPNVSAEPARQSGRICMKNGRPRTNGRVQRRGCGVVSQILWAKKCVFAFHIPHIQVWAWTKSLRGFQAEEHMHRDCEWTNTTVCLMLLKSLPLLYLLLLNLMQRLM